MPWDALQRVCKSGHLSASPGSRPTLNTSDRLPEKKQRLFPAFQIHLLITNCVHFSTLLSHN